MRVNLPQYRRPGETAQLQCDYDLGNDTLYAVKWYKDDEEFYRFVTKERPQATSHRVDGVRVAVAKSDSRRVILPAVDVRTGGLYRCEVSAEAPSFASAQSEARMDVISFPSEDPKITGMKIQYQIGDNIDINCTSGRSFPATILHWYINEKPILVSGDKAQLINYPARQHKDGLITSVLGLRFALHAHHFRGGDSMRVKCVASVSPAVVENLPVRDLREALLLVKNDATTMNIRTSILVCIMAFRVLLNLLHSIASKSRTFSI